MNLDEEKKAFEEWFRESGKHSLYIEHMKGNNPSLKNAFTIFDTAWQSWQAAKAYEAEKSKGCVMVPVESIEAALLWMDEDIDAHHMSNDGFDKLFEHKPILEKILLEAARGRND